MGYNYYFYASFSINPIKGEGMLLPYIGYRLRVVNCVVNQFQSKSILRAQYFHYLRNTKPIRQFWTKICCKFQMEDLSMSSLENIFNVFKRMHSSSILKFYK